MKKVLACISNRLFALFAVDPRSLAFTRVCVGVLLLLTYLNFVPYMQDYFNDDAIIGRRSALDSTRGLRYSLYLINGHPFFPHLLLLVSIVAAVFLMIGVYPRIAAFASLILFNSLTVSSDPMNFGLHHATNCILFWMVFLPYKKIPRWVTARPVDSPFFSLAALGMILVSLTICVGAGLVKLREPDFWLFRADAIQQFASYYTNINPLTQLLMMFPGVARFLTRLTIVVELFCVPAMFFPFYNRSWRIVSLIISTVFFLNASLFIHVGLFPVVPLGAMYAFTPACAWDWMLERPLTRSLLRGFNLVGFGRTFLRLAERVRLVSAVKLLARLATLIFIAAFAVNIWNNYCRRGMEVAEDFVHRSPVWELLEFSSLNRGWDFMYGGRMNNRFLIVEYRGDNYTSFRNPTHIRYRWPMFNYEMNYANSIMNHKEESDRLRHYAKNLCVRGRSQAHLVSDPLEVSLYDLSDRDNRLGAFTESDQELLRQNVKGMLPFLRYSCANIARPKPVLPSHDDRPLTPEEFPVVGWTQGYGSLSLNTTVDGKPISLGGQKQIRALGAHADSNIAVAIEGARRFSAIVGIDDERADSPKASVFVEVFGDDQLLFRSPLLIGSSGPVKVDVSVAGKSELRLLAHGSLPGQVKDIDDDHVSWGQIHLE